MTDTALSGLYRLSVRDRIEALANAGCLRPEDAGVLLRGAPLLPVATADRMIENVIGVFGLPFGVAPNLRVNGKDYLVPMVVEEPSIVAAVAGAAKLLRRGGGIAATSTGNVLTGQIQVIDIDDPDRAVQTLYAARDELLQLANSLQPGMQARGGGARELEYFKFRLPNGHWTVVVHVLIDTCDAMGANTVNTICEGLAPRVEALSGGKSGISILSNLADKALVRAQVTVPLAALGGRDYTPEAIRDGIVQATAFANADPYRAATHNKGIMNGIDAVAIATGNDWRAIEAGAHAFAARRDHYRALSNWVVDADGNLAGELVLPLKVGIVGGSLLANPGARTGLAISGVETAAELACLMGATGLAQNFAALRALVSTGIQAGHMKLHARSVAASAAVPDAVFDQVVAAMIDTGDIKQDQARALSAKISRVQHAEGRAKGTACGKVILLGEHAAVYDRHVLALPVASAVTAGVQKTAAGVVLRAPDWGIAHSWQADAASLSGAAGIVQLIMRELGVSALGLEIIVRSRIPVAMGLGASAAFAVAIIRALDELLGLGQSDVAINRLAFRCESVAHGTPSGIDNNVATFGEAVLFVKGKRSGTRPLEITEMPPLIVAASGTPGMTKEMVSGVRRRYERHKDLYNTIFDEIDEMAVAGAVALQHGDYEKLGAMMNICQGFLNAIEVSTPELEQMIAIARSAGACGAKLTGAGGGGSIVALCPGKVDDVGAALSQAGYRIISLSGDQQQ